MDAMALMLKYEKSYYPFKRYPRQKSETVLFPGCSFPSHFPKTMDKLEEICTSAGIGVAFDCCGQPVDGMGVHGGTQRVLKGVEKRLSNVGCKRAATVCPNCYKLFKQQLSIPTISVFELFDELGIASQDNFEEGVLFVPCPDRSSHELHDRLRNSYDLSGVITLNGVGCCGLRSEIVSQGQAAVRTCTDRIIDTSKGRPIYTYCASCLGQFARCGNENCRHVVSVILGVDEKPETNRAFLNRAKRMFDKNVEPSCFQ